MNFLPHPGYGHIYFFTKKQWTLKCFCKFFSCINFLLHLLQENIEFSLWKLLCLSNSSFVSNKYSQSSISHLKHFTKFEFRLFLFKKHLNKFLLFFSGFSISTPDEEAVSFWWCSTSKENSLEYFSFFIFDSSFNGIISSCWDIIIGWRGIL